MPAVVPTLLKPRRSLRPPPPLWAVCLPASRRESSRMPTSIEAEADAILDGDGHLQAAQAKWERLTAADLRRVRTKRDLIDRVQERYGVPREQASVDVEVWASDKHFATW